MRVFYVMLLVSVFAVAGFAQTELAASSDRNEQNAPVDLKSGETITRGEALSNKATKISVEKGLENPADYSEGTFAVEGVIVRSCQKAGCWMEMADKVGGKSVRVTFGSHAFFIPLNSAGMKVKAEGRFVTKTLAKDVVDHLINDDGAVFKDRNDDGTVTEVSFDATGVVLTKEG